jgi:hypothetical protein
MFMEQSVPQETFHRHRSRRSTPPPAIPGDSEFLVREGALHDPGYGRMLIRASAVPRIVEPPLPLEEAVDRRETDPTAVLSLIVGSLSALVLLVGIVSSVFFHVASFFAFASVVLGIFSFSRIRSNRPELKGEMLALTGAVIGSIVLSIYLGLFGVFGLGV